MYNDYIMAPTARTTGGVTNARFISINDPTLPTREAPMEMPPQPSTGMDYGMVRCLGIILALLAAVTIALGVVDVVITMQNYCMPSGANWCSSTTEPYIWVWVASGIWGSVPIFMAGLFGMCLASNPMSHMRTFQLAIFLSAFVFAPAIVVLSSIEVWRGMAAQYTFYTSSGGGVAPGNIAPANNPYQAKYAMPLAIAVLGAVMFLISMLYTCCLCCCNQGQGMNMQPQQAAPAPAPAPAPVAPLPPSMATNTYFNRQEYYPQRPQIKAADYSSGNYGDYYPASRFTSAAYPPAIRYTSGPSPFMSGPGTGFGSWW